jgi:hypothetical protein
MPELTIQEEHARLFTTYTPYSSNHRAQITEWIANDCQGEFLLESIAVQIQPPFKSLSEYYASLTNKSLKDFINSVDMFPGFTLGYRYNGTEFKFYLTKF